MNYKVFHKGERLADFLASAEYTALLEVGGITPEEQLVSTLRIATASSISGCWTPHGREDGYGGRGQVLRVVGSTLSASILLAREHPTASRPRGRRQGQKTSIILLHIWL